MPTTTLCSRGSSTPPAPWWNPLIRAAAPATLYVCGYAANELELAREQDAAGYRDTRTACAHCGAGAGCGGCWSSLRTIVGIATGSRPQLSERLVGVVDSLGVDVAGGSPVGDFLPVGPGEYPLDRDYLGGPQPRLDALAEGARQCLLVVEHVLREPSRQARCGEYQPMKRQYLGMIIESGD